MNRDWLSERIVEIYEQEQPKLCEIIKEMVNKRAKYADFKAFVMKRFGTDSSLTASASLTIFKYYKCRAVKSKPPKMKN